MYASAVHSDDFAFPLKSFGKRTTQKMAFLRLLLVDKRCHRYVRLQRRLQLLRDVETHLVFNRASSSMVSSLFRGEDERARSGLNDNDNTYLSTRKGPDQRDCANARRMFSSFSASTSSSSVSTSDGDGGMNDVVTNKSSEKVDALLEQFTSLTAKEKRDVFQSLFVTTERGESDMSEKERKMFEAFDSDGDKLLTPEEFQNFHRAFLWRHLQEQQVISDEREEEEHGGKEITYAQLKSVALSQMYPFIGFGFLDNALMLAFGETIEASVGISLGLSTMAAAAIGNTLSDVCGVGLANKIEYLCSKFGLTEEVKMTTCQAKEMRVVVARLGGAMTGVTMGCIAGSFPLLFH